MIEPYLLTATQALDLIKTDNLTVETFARSLLSRIATRDSTVHAWAHLDPEFVISQARILDAIPAAQRGPLHGIAIGVKDVILTKDMPTAHNSAIYKDNPSLGIDAAPIITLRASGALIFGKTTTTEFAATTDGGPSANPHDPTRTPGGSSSGSGAAVADFQVPIALGTQTGGSTIRPGSYNGIFALKPTWGSISREGLAQFSVTCDTLGLYARSVEDLELLCKVFQMEDDDPIPAISFSLKGAKVAFCKTPQWHAAGSGTQTAFENAEKILKNHEATVEQVELPEEFANVEKWHGNVLAGEGRSSFLGNMLLGGDMLHHKLQGHVRNVTKLSRAAQLEAYDGCAKLRPLADEILGKYDAFITPSVPDIAPIGIENTGSAVFCSPWSVLQVPVINIPGFAGESGMPIGLSLVGARYMDMHLLHVAKAIGAVFGAEGGFVSKIKG